MGASRIAAGLGRRRRVCQRRFHPSWLYKSSNGSCGTVTAVFRYLVGRFPFPTSTMLIGGFFWSAIRFMVCVTELRLMVFSGLLAVTTL